MVTVVRYHNILWPKHSRDMELKAGFNAFCLYGLDRQIGKQVHPKQLCGLVTNVTSWVVLHMPSTFPGVLMR